MNAKLPKITNRCFGIEIEFVGADLREVCEAINEAGVRCRVEYYNHNTVSHWKLVTDVSLASVRGYAGELVSPILSGEAGVRELEIVLNALNSVEGVTINASCGLHVHLDCREMNLDEIKTTYERYGDYEDQIDMCMPRSRRGSPRWCAGLGSTVSSVKRTTTKSSAAMAARGRYFKVNLVEIAGRGSIEFRQHSGTTEFKKIINWLSFLMQFTETSIELSAAVKTSSSRWYSQLRTIIENWGGEMNYAQKTKTWNITKEGATFARFTNEYIVENFYLEGAACRSSGMVGIFTVRSLLAEVSVNLLITNAATEPKKATKNDDGLFMGISAQIQDYIAERTQELA